MNTRNKRTLEEVLSIFRRKYLRPQSQVTAEHNWHELTFNRTTKSLSVFLKELNKCVEPAFWPPAQQMTESLVHAKLLPHLKLSINLACLENGRYDQISAHLERGLELSGLNAVGETPVSTMSTTTRTVTKQAQRKNSEKPHKICRYSKNRRKCE